MGHRMTGEIAEAARLHDQDGDPYLAKIRRITARLGSADVDPDDLQAALLTVEDHASIDLDVPAGSNHKGVEFIKRTVRLLIGWYLSYVGNQVTLLGHAILRLGTALVNRTEGLEETTATLAGTVAALAARVEQLEKRSDCS